MSDSQHQPAIAQVGNLYITNDYWWLTSYFFLGLLNVLNIFQTLQKVHPAALYKPLDLASRHWSKTWWLRFWGIRASRCEIFVKRIGKVSTYSIYIYWNSFSGFLGVPNFRWHTVSIGWLGCPFKRSQRFSSKASLLRAVGEQLVEDQPNPRPWICLVDWFHRFDGQLRRFWRLIMLL